MTFFDFIILLLQLGVGTYFFHKLLEAQEHIRDITKLILHNSDVFAEQLAKTQRTHYEQLEKTSTKQLQILEKQTKDFLSAMTDFIEVLKKKEIEEPETVPHLLDREKIKNSIEEEAVEEVPLSEIARLPNINDLNIRFEDDEQILPLDNFQ